MEYPIIQPPFTLQFREMSKPELKSYFEWFMKMIPERIEVLERAVRESPEYSSWSADCSSSSLKGLGEWFVGQVETRERSSEELDAIKLSLSFPMEIDTEELTNRTFSLAMDIGMYFSQVVLTSLPGTKWEQYFGNKRDADYGQPVIMGFGVVPLNPVSIIVTLAYGISRGKRSGGRLSELYDTWAKLRK